MKKIGLTSILILILFTSLVKNSTKEIEDRIFIISENIRSLKTQFEDEVLEYNYLSSPKKLIQHQSQYFEHNLVKIGITKIKKISLRNNNLEITDFIDKN
tara:strand:+ start:378 stop:677 length:300 start_codon:yes stop_codon:yes gene_type:complete